MVCCQCKMHNEIHLFEYNKFRAIQWTISTTIFWEIEVMRVNTISSSQPMEPPMQPITHLATYVLGQRIICRPLWPIRSPDVMSFHFSMWMIQTTFITTTHTEDGLKIVISCAMENCVRPFPAPALTLGKIYRCSS